MVFVLFIYTYLRYLLHSMRYAYINEILFSIYPTREPATYSVAQPNRKLRKEYSKCLTSIVERELLRKNYHFERSHHYFFCNL